MLGSTMAERVVGRDADETVGMKLVPGLVGQAELHAHLDAVHELCAEQLLAGLVPAIEVAWADGVIQDHERELIFKLAKDAGLDRDVEAMERIHSWLATPPTNQESRDALDRLRELERRHGRDVLADVIAKAQAVARADGGLFGIGSVNADERRAIEWLETVLRADWEDDHPGHEGSPMLGVLGVFYELLADRAKADTEHKNVIPPGEHDMWPQPSLWDPEHLAPAVIGVPHHEYKEYESVIVGRYLRSLKTSWWDAICHAAMHPGVSPLDDEKLAEMVIGAPFGRFLCPHLDPADKASFGQLIDEAAKLGVPHKVDMRHLAPCQTLPEMYLAGTVGLFALAGDELIPVAIEVEGKVFRPGDGEAWERARYFLIQACSVTVVLGAHPKLHFPMDSVIGVTREVVPEDHPVRRLIDVHAWLHLPLDYGVSYNQRSVAHNHQNEIYTPFPIRRDEVFANLVGQYYAGTPGNSARPAYRYPMGPPTFPGRYARFLTDYYEVVLEFCRAVAAAVPARDPILAAWGAALHEVLPGFPTVAELRDREVLARALAGFVHTVSVWHSADHHTFGEYPVNQVPQRLRVPPPKGGDPSVPLERWVRAVDIVRQELARRLFYQAHTVRSILEVDYGFAEPELERAVAEFHRELRACDQRQAVRFIPLDRIACSLQF